MQRGAYTNYLLEKWNEIRPKLPLSSTALSTRGNRLFSRASNDIAPQKAWLGKKDLDVIEKRVMSELGVLCHENPSYESVPNDSAPGPNEMNGDTYTPPLDPEYECLLKRSIEIFVELSQYDILEQPRKPLKKKNLSSKQLSRANAICDYLLKELNGGTGHLDIANTILYSVATVFTNKEGEELMGLHQANNGREKGEKQQPPWRARLERTITNLRKEVDILNEFANGKLKKNKGLKFAQAIMKKYGNNGSKRDMAKLVFNLKNKISVATMRLRRYDTQVLSRKQNNTFNTNRKQFYRDIGSEGDIKVTTPPQESDLREFWGGQIWGQSNLYNPSAEWIPEWKKAYVDVKEQEWCDISVSELKNQLGRSMNWKAPGVDLVPNYWLKNITSLHPELASMLNNCIKSPESTPKWLVTGKSTLLPKNDQTMYAKNYRPITCLTTTFKTLTGIIASKIEKHLRDNNIMDNAQQGAIRGSYGTKQQLLINETLLEHALKTRRSLSVTYYDYAKAYDSVPHEWIIETLSTYKVNPIIVNFLKWIMPMWSTKLILRHENGVLEVSNIRICRGIFQGDSLSPLLFILAINPVSFLLNKNQSGYKIENVTISHILYMDDLKTFAGNAKH